jgi:hypothetical protein
MTDFFRQAFLLFDRSHPLWRCGVKDPYSMPDPVLALSPL